TRAGKPEWLRRTGRDRGRWSLEGPPESRDQPCLEPKNAGMVAMSAPNLGCWLFLSPRPRPHPRTSPALGARAKKGRWECEAGITGQPEAQKGCLGWWY
ncbi:unnamed protein product, partial [Gulo gulo]